MATAMEGSCMDLALEGERLCKSGDCRTGVQFFESAIQVGTDDLKTLSAIYSQLGNAYFYLQEYGKALEYHKHDLNLARTLHDKLGEAKASGNLGNTLKVLGKFDEAIACCERHLDISRELGDQIGEARALYNLGNVYHAKGKHVGRSAQQDPGEFPPEVKDSLSKAASYYEQNLEQVRRLDDRAAQGRACGNLGNTHYLLGNFGQAITFHEERLSIAKEFGDKSAERRAYSNLGNAHIFLGEFDVAADQYKKTLQIAKELSDRALEAQACYSLGNTYTLLRDFELAIEYHVRHLNIAKDLEDKVGEGRACWSLGNAHTSLGHHEQAMQFAARHLEISKEIGDETGQVTAQMNLMDLKKLLGITTKNSAETENTADSDKLDAGARRANRGRRQSMENLDLMKLTPDKAKAEAEKAARMNGGAKPKVPKVHRLEKAASVATEKVSDMPAGKSGKSKRDEMMDDDSFFELLSRFQSRRIDDQRCSFRVPDGPTPPTQRPNPPRRQSDSDTRSRKMEKVQTDEFLDMVAGIQGSRMNDQRAAMPEFPGLHNSQEVIDQLMTNSSEESTPLDDGFFEMLMRCQGSRIEDQRSSLPTRSAPTVPDEDFFSLIQRIQSNRLDEQRTTLPSALQDVLQAAPGASPAASKPLAPSSSKKRKDKTKDKENKKDVKK